MKKTILILCLALVACGQNASSKVINYDYSDVESHIDWYDSFKQEENNYLVYYYSPTCSHCNSIKQEIISYYLSEVEVLYFVNTQLNSKFGPTKDLTGICDINSFHIFGTPFLIRVKDYKVADYYPGMSKILDYLNR